MPELGNVSGPKPHHSAPGRMASFTDTLGRLAAECAHKKRKASCEGHAEEVRAALAKQWEEVDKEASQALAREHAEGVYKMKYKCAYEIHEKELLLLLPEELQEDVKMKQIDCHRCEGGYSIEFYFGHKRDRFLEELEKQDPSPFAKKQRVEDEADDDAGVDGDAALEVKDDDVALSKESVATRAEYVRGLTNPKHVDIMKCAVEALGFTIGPLCTLALAWERALLHHGRKASLAYAAAIAEVEASA